MTPTLESISLSNENFTNLTDCYNPDDMKLKAFAIRLKPYMMPATIEFSITCATIFLLTWSKIGSKNKNLILPPTRENIKGIGGIKMPSVNSYIMLDCTKTSRGLFFGILMFVISLLGFILTVIYGGSVEDEYARLISEIIESFQLLVSMTLTCIAFFKVRKHYAKVVPEINMFDIVLEVVSLCGVYVFNINALIAIIFDFLNSGDKKSLTDYKEYMLDSVNVYSSDPATNPHFEIESLTIMIMSGFNAFMSVLQSTAQTFFILECLGRYAYANKPFLKKPARELITALLSIEIIF